MVGKCRRCNSIRGYLYEERHEVVCTFCLVSGFLVHMQLIPKEITENKGMVIIYGKEQYLTWKEYGKQRLYSPLNDTDNLEQRVQGLSEDSDT